MAKGQIHMGKNGPEKCSVDTSNSRSRGCPYAATGHYATTEEAMDGYADLNRVDSSELKELVKDGASPKDAVGLIRSGYGRDYLTAAKKDINRVPDTSLEDESAEYLEAKTRISLELEGLSSRLVVKGIGGPSKDSVIVVRGFGRNLADSFNYGITEKDGELTLITGATKGGSESSKAIAAKLSAAFNGDNPELKAELSRMLTSYRKMAEEETARRS